MWKENFHLVAKQHTCKLVNLDYILHIQYSTLLSLGVYISMADRGKYHYYLEVTKLQFPTVIVLVVEIFGIWEIFGIY